MYGYHGKMLWVDLTQKRVDIRNIDEDVFEKVWADVQGKGLSLSEAQVREKMLALLEVAREQVTAE